MAEGNTSKDGSTDPNELRNFTSTNSKPASTNQNLGSLFSKPAASSAHVEGSKGIKKTSRTKNINHKQTNTPFTVCHWNCGSGITKKLSDIQIAINELKPTVIFISEADRKINHDDKLIQIRGYQLHNAKSLEKHGKSRIVAYTREENNIKRRQDLENSDAELVVFDKIYPNSSNVDRIIGLYRPFTGPDGDKSSGGAWVRYEVLIHTIHKALDGCQRATIIGDINVDLLKGDEVKGRFAEALTKLCDENSLEQLIHQPTRIQPLETSEGLKIQESLLDHIYSSDTRSVKKCGCMHLSQSDHLAVYISYNNSEKKSTEKKVIYKRDHRFYDKQAIATLCETEDWSDVYNTADTQECYNILEKKLTNIVNTVAPLRKVIICEKHPISNHALRSLENRRRTLYKRMKNSKTNKSIKDYKLIKKKIKTKVKDIYKAEISKMLKNRNMKNLWQGVNTICGRNTSQTEHLNLLDPVSGNNVSDSKVCADIFSRTFQNKVGKLTEQVGNKDAMVDQISQKLFNISEETCPQFEIQNIIEVIYNMKKSSSSGHDAISLNYIKDAAKELAPILKFVFDKVALFAKMPVQWKLAKIIPLHKKGSKENPENYRPISLLCSMGKVFEKCLLNIMTAKFGNCLPSTFQHGFRKNHSTSTAALTVQSIIAKALDKKKKVVVVSTDMSAAFDLLDKDVLLPRMIKLGIPLSLCKIYDEFLSDRKAFVQCGQSRSEPFNIPFGCVQGSPSGPYLFTLLVDGISEYMEDVSIVAYADDMYFIYEADTWDEAAAQASYNTKKAMEWLKRSGMVLNASKTEACYFATKELERPPKMEIDGVNIEIKKTLKVLGLTFDHKLSWDIHIEKLLKEVNSRTQAIRHIQQHLTRKECLNVAHGLFFAKFYYCSGVWLTEMLSKSLLNRLTSASNSCLRATLGYRIKDISTCELHKGAGILTPYQRLFQDKAITFWKILNSCEPHELFMDLLTQGSVLDRNRSLYLRTYHHERIGKSVFANRLNDIVPFLGLEWLEQSEFTMKKTVKNFILETIPAKCV